MFNLRVDEVELTLLESQVRMIDWCQFHIKRVELLRFTIQTLLY